MTEKSLDEKTFSENIADRLSNLMRAPDPDPGSFQKAMDVANPEGDHKKKVWSKGIEKIRKKISEDENVTQEAEADNILDELRKKREAASTARGSISQTEKKTKVLRSYSGSKASIKIVGPNVESPQEEWSDEVLEKVAEGFSETPEKYILIKGIPVPEDNKEPLWLKVTAGSDEFYFDKAMEESISVPFKMDRARFPLQLEISIWDENFAETKFKRIGIFPADATVKRVVTDLSSRGREVKGITDGSQESIKKFAKELTKRRAEEKDPDWFASSNISHSHSLSISCSGPMVTSAIGAMPILQHNGQNHWATSDTLSEDSELTDNMEIQLEGKIKTAIDDLREEIRNEVMGGFEDTKRNIINDLQNGRIPIPSGDIMAPNFENVAGQTQIYSQHDMEEILTEVVQKQKDKKAKINPPVTTELFSHRDMDLGSLVAHSGVQVWEAENRLEDFFEKVIKGEENDHGDLE